jgi:hypothetical protein
MPNLEALHARVKALHLRGLLAHWTDAGAAEWVERLIDWEEQERGRRSLERRLKDSHVGRFTPNGKRAIAKSTWKASKAIKSALSSYLKSARKNGSRESRVTTATYRQQRSSNNGRRRWPARSRKRRSRKPRKQSPPVTRITLDVDRWCPSGSAKRACATIWMGGTVATLGIDSTPRIARDDPPKLSRS